MTDVPINHDRDSEQGGGRAPLRSRGAGRGGPIVIFLVAVLVVAGIGLAGVALGQSKGSAEGTISVSGSGTVQGRPDTVSFQIGVQSVAGSAASALTENNARMRALQRTLGAHGVLTKDTQTSGLNIYANTNNAGTVTGFTVVDTLNVVMHHVNQAGGAIDAAARVVGNGVQLYGVSFSISNESTLLAAARAKAMARAHTQAAEVANGGHVSLGAIVRITDQENATAPTYPYYDSFKLVAAAGVPIQGGSQSITVQVSVVYALQQ